MLKYFRASFFSVRFRYLKYGIQKIFIWKKTYNEENVSTKQWERGFFF